MAEVLDQQQTSWSGIQQWVDGTNYTGQIFQAGLSGDLTTVKLWSVKIGSPANLIVEIQGEDGGGKPNGAVLASQEILASAVPSYAELTVIFSSPYTIVSGTKYAIVLHQKTDGGGPYPNDTYGFYGTGSNPYANGTQCYSINSGSSWSITALFDLYFKTYVTIGEVTVLSDIYNDFRMIGTSVLADINNDFRLVDYINNNINNDFRMVGAPAIYKDINNDFRNRKEERIDINNKFRTVKLELKDINNKFNNCIEVKENVENIVNWVKQEIKDISCDVRTKKETYNNVNNDFRMLSPWQLPGVGEIGFQSTGKTEVKVYINSVEQTDVDIDSLSISQILNGAHTASFSLGRPYDGAKSTDKSVVEIKYNGVLLYEGYITDINPGDTPESININCQDEYWELNKTKKYFIVGRKPADTNEFYYETIEEALDGFGLSFGIGNFIPQSMDLYGNGTSDAITNLVQNSGNFSWFIKPDGSKILWQAGKGNIIDLEKQELDKNLGLYQVIKHNIIESISNIVNKLKVQMGDWTIRKSTTDRGSGQKTYTYIWYEKQDVFASPAWDSDLEELMRQSSDGFGYDRQHPDKDYKDVFRKFDLPWLDPKYGSWTDIYPPVVEVTSGEYMGQTKKYIIDGFTIDYKVRTGFNIPSEVRKNYPTIIFSEPQVNYDINSSGECYNVYSKSIRLKIWKLNKYTYTTNIQNDPNTAPIEDESNPLMFYTDKMGDYSETILGDLNLGGLSKQDGFIILDINGEILERVPSWNDVEFAKDYANWQLSKTCDKKITGTIDLTIDAMLYYNIDLAKRIKIEGIVEPINIKSITYNFNNFIATINVESNRYYKRTESIQYRGE